MKTIKYRGNYINGRFVVPTRRTATEVSEDPGDLDHPLGEFVFSEDAVPEAVEAARKGFHTWSRKSPLERTAALIQFKKALIKHREEFALLITREMGKPIAESKSEIDRIVDKIELTRREEPELLKPIQYKLDKGVVARLRYRPRGVMAILSPFNVPAYLACSLIIPALANGNSVILKPSELTPFCGQFIAALLHEAHFPNGVFNLVQGTGPVGKALVEHDGVDGVLFVGSWQTGHKIQQAVHQDPRKLCALEMGGKNAAVICRDADLDLALEATLIGAFMTTGQRCNATSRIIIERSIAKKFIGRYLERVDQLSVGYGTDKDIFMGPLVSLRGFENVKAYRRKAEEEGFDVLRRGPDPEVGRKGYYLAPSVHFMDGMPKIPWQDGSYTDDEVFGPDVAIYAVKNMEQAMQLNNRPAYGLVSSLFTRSKHKFEKFFATAESGLVHWNMPTVKSAGKLPFGGLKRSGNDRPIGFFSPFLCTVPTASLENRPKT